MKTYPQQHSFSLFFSNHKGAVMRRFELHREVDETGVSGTGIVAQGIEFDDGHVAMRWISEWTSTAVFDNIFAVEAIHGHNGLTKIVWLNDMVRTSGEK